MLLACNVFVIILTATPFRSHADSECLATTTEEEISILQLIWANNSKKTRRVKHSCDNRTSARTPLHAEIDVALPVVDGGIHATLSQNVGHGWRHEQHREEKDNSTMKRFGKLCNGRVCEGVCNGCVCEGASTLSGQEPSTIQQSRHINLPCGFQIRARDMQSGSRCPKQCPLFAERVVAKGEPCFFRCVEPNACGQEGTDPLARVPDQKRGICRRCAVAGCEKCANFPRDVCAKCAPGFQLHGGRCRIRRLFLWGLLLAVICIFAVPLLIWFLDLLCCRKRVNERGLIEGEEFRKKRALRNRDHTTGEGSRYPLTTNLLDEPVAGRGTTLFFNFQLFLIMWSGIMALAWFVLASSVDYDLLSLGFQSANSPREFCMVVHWGYARQHANLWVKWCFCLGAYLFSFGAALLYAALQEYRFHKLDAETTTMMDFAAVCTGLPPLSGKDKVEQDLHTFVTDRLGQGVVGVSVCWDFSMHPELGKDSLQEEFDEVCTGALVSSFGHVRKPGLLRKAFNFIDEMLGFPDCPSILGDGPAAIDIKEMLEDLKCTGSAFVIFSTEAERDSAVDSAQAEGLEFMGHALRLQASTYEPDTVLWPNLHVRPSTKHWRTLTGFLLLLLFLCLWVLFFFLPAALYLESFSSALGKEFGIVCTCFFTLLVVAGNQIMYLSADAIASRIGFHLEDSRQTAYVIMYLTACVLQVLLDILFMAKTSYKEMVGLGVRTDAGTLIEKLMMHDEIFESYAMQRSIGQHLYSYTWPATFLLPFICEPLGVVLLPGIVQRRLVSSKAWVVGREAEKSMDFFAPMDLSRYGDVLLNATLGVLFAFLPHGLFSAIFCAMCCSHIYIILYDHWRTLRAVREFNFSGNTMHAAAQELFAVPVGILLAAAVFKSNCGGKLVCGITLPCAHGAALLGRCASAFLVHIVVHVALLRCLSCCLQAGHDKEPSSVHYDKAALWIPHTWFNTNPIHCLRSQHIYHDSVPCRHYRPGQKYQPGQKRTFRSTSAH